MTLKKRCEICSNWFTARREQKTCSYRCSNKRSSRLLTGRPWPEKRKASNRRKAIRTAELLVKDRFGDLSDRDLALFREGARIGYKTGYHTARYSYTTRMKMAS